MKKPILIDLDGVLRLGNEPAPHISEFLTYLEKNSIKTCILSNSSINNSVQIYNFFNSHSIEINFPIITAIDAAYLYIKKRYKKVAVFVSENVVGQFSEFLNFDNPEAVLIGDIGDMWNYKLMQTIFEYINRGAELVVAHKNRFWNKPEVGIQLDAGPFIHGIEYATSKNATLIGKPSKQYFEIALEKINYNKDNSFMMLGDDLETDIKGSKKVGAETILIYTGKTNKATSIDKNNEIDFEADNLLDVIKILSQNRKS